jgi:hypothetical protein
MPNKAFRFLLIVLLTAEACFAQQTGLLNAVDQFNTEANKIQPWNAGSQVSKNGSASVMQSGVKQYLEKFSNPQFLTQLTGKFPESDSLLIIGATPGDSLIITGEWLCEVDILVFGDGILRFKNANVTLLGDLYVWGETAEITADSSTLYIPQQYFYQRSIVAAGAGKVKFSHVTLDFSGLSHNIVAADSSTYDFTDVKKNGFTTNGLSGKAKYYINGTNLAGEFVIGDKCELDFRNANTVLLWHQVPETGVFHFNFPPAGNVPAHDFNPGVPGISNIDYQIKLENCTDVMWALMPANGSDVDISDSEIRAIGLWFLAPDPVNVNGLVNNTDYQDFTASLSDRNLRLRNSSVQTWSLYSMKGSEISVTGCILGEIGSMGTSKVSTTSVFVDGSGGYMWATDTTFFMAFQTPLTTHVRSDRNGILIYAYSPLTMGSALAIGSSTLITVQSSLPEEPLALDKASVWNVNIASPSSGNTNSIIPVKGWALIDRAPACTHPDMDWYQLFYSTPENDSLIAITPRINFEKRNDTLAEWNTTGLKPGQYLLHMRVSNAAEIPVAVDAVKTISLNPGVFGIDQYEITDLKIFPNPVTEVLHCDFPDSNSLVSISNSSGAIVWQDFPEKDSSTINVKHLPAGLYILTIFDNGRMGKAKFIKM